MLALATSSQGCRLSSWPGFRTVCEKRASRFCRLALEVQGGSWMRWCTDEIFKLGRQKQENPEFKVILGNSKFQDNLGYVRPCLK